MSVAMIQFNGSVRVKEEGGDSTSMALDFSRGGAALSEIQVELKANTATHSVATANIAPIRVLALDCKHPILLTLGAASTSTFTVRSNLVMTTNYSTISFRNQSSVVNTVRLMLGGGAGPA